MTNAEVPTEPLPEVKLLVAADIDWRQVQQFSTHVEFIGKAAYITYGGMKLVTDQDQVAKIHELLPEYLEHRSLEGGSD